MRFPSVHPIQDDLRFYSSTPRQTHQPSLSPDSPLSPQTHSSHSSSNGSSPQFRPQPASPLPSHMSSHASSPQPQFVFKTLRSNSPTSQFTKSRHTSPVAFPNQADTVVISDDESSETDVPTKRARFQPPQFEKSHYFSSPSPTEPPQTVSPPPPQILHSPDTTIVESTGDQTEVATPLEFTTPTKITYSRMNFSLPSSSTFRSNPIHSVSPIKDKRKMLVHSPTILSQSKPLPMIKSGRLTIDPSRKRMSLSDFAAKIQSPTTRPLRKTRTGPEQVNEE
eukprot:c12980_g1_i1.p1 GENE.c12980_g1_i1~~c12980_g1_i1.p1  ORF type:complete len:311 (-),score=57.10 c12980_g1_i1:54-893(-)